VMAERVMMAMTGYKSWAIVRPLQHRQHQGHRGRGTENDSAQRKTR
jgi:hypothetical protein